MEAKSAHERSHVDPIAAKRKSQQCLQFAIDPPMNQSIYPTNRSPSRTRLSFIHCSARANPCYMKLPCEKVWSPMLTRARLANHYRLWLCGPVGILMLCRAGHNFHPTLHPGSALVVPDHLGQMKTSSRVDGRNERREPLHPLVKYCTEA